MLDTPVKNDDIGQPHLDVVQEIPVWECGSTDLNGVVVRCILIQFVNLTHLSAILDHGYNNLDMGHAAIVPITFTSHQDAERVLGYLNTVLFPVEEVVYK